MKNIKLRILLFLIILITTLTILLNCPQPDNSSNGGGNSGSNGEGNESSSTYSAVGLYDTTFNNGGTGADIEIRSIAIQSDGKILIGGWFSNYNGGYVPNNIIRLNTDGSYDSTFNNGSTGADGTVYSIAIQSDGKILIGGDFTRYNGVNVPDDIIRLNANGSYDTTFNIGGTGADGEVRSIAIQSDGKILIGGWFSNYNGIDVPDNIIRLLNANGSYDTAFNNGGIGADSTVYSIAVQSDGKILIGGDFTQYNGINNVPDHIIRLNVNGIYDSTFNNGGSGPNGRVTSIAIQSNGKILIGGGFVNYNYINVPSDIIRLNTDGSHDPTFNNGGSGIGFGGIDSIAIQSDGKILIGGSLLDYNGVDVPDGIIRLNTDGSHDPTFNNGGSGIDDTVYSIAIQSDGKVLIGGVFVYYNGVDVPDHIIRLY